MSQSMSRIMLNNNDDNTTTTTTTLTNADNVPKPQRCAWKGVNRDT